MRSRTPQVQIRGQSTQPERTSSGLRRFFKVFFGRKVVLVGTVIIVALFITAAFAPQLAPYDPYKQDYMAVLKPPSHQYLLGTDTLGRDVLSRIIYASRTTIIIGFFAIAVASIIGMTLGLMAGYLGGWVNMIIMRFVDAMMNFPVLLFALLLAAVLGGGVVNLIIAIGVGMVPGYARMMCGQALTITENDYVLAARSLRATPWRVMLRHVAPNAFPPLIVMVTTQIGHTIMAEAGLSFLGVGIKPPGASWGAMTSDGYKYLLINPYYSLIPGMIIMAVVFAFNMVGDGLRDALDPRLRGTL